MAKIEFDGLNLVARDVDATVAFYRLLGVEIPDDAIWGTDSGPHHVKADIEGRTDIALNSDALASSYNAGFRDDAATRTLIGFRLKTRESVDETYARLIAAGAPGLQEPYDAFWGARHASWRIPMAVRSAS